MKTCKCCKKEKPLDDFGINRKLKDERNIYCILCAREKNRKQDKDRKIRNMKKLNEVIVESKTCVSCNVEKNSDDFYKTFQSKDGLTPWCKSCDSEKSKQRRSKYKKEIIIEGERECVVCNVVKYINEFPSHKGKKGGYRHECNDCRNEHLRNRYNNEPLYKLKRLVRARIGTYIKLKNAPTKNVLGCSWDFYEKYLAERFDKGMSWDNHGDWEIDHIIPLASAKDENELIKLFHYTNTKPLWYDENRSKGDKIIN